MPLYEYECQKCHRKTEKIEKVNGPHLKKCPHCDGKVERMISRTSMQFKGTGWYVTDYASKGSKAGSESGAAESGGKGSSESKDGAAKEAGGESSGAVKDGKESASKEASKDSGKESKKVEEKKPAKKK